MFALGSDRKARVLAFEHRDASHFFGKIENLPENGQELALLAYEQKERVVIPKICLRGAQLMKVSCSPPNTKQKDLGETCNALLLPPG